MSEFEGKVVVVTGAGGGLGKAHSLEFARRGAKVVVNDLGGSGDGVGASDMADVVVDEITQAGGTAIANKASVATMEGAQSIIDDAVSEFGTVDILINNAGIFSTITMRPFSEIPLAEWNQVMHVNVTGVFLMTRAVAPSMKQQGFGRIINISSAAVTMGRPGYLHYIASKSALLGMSRSLAHELGGDGVTVNSLLPGATETEIDRATVSPEQRKAMMPPGRKRPRISSGRWQAIPIKFRK